MILTVDMGNTNIFVGLHHDGKVVSTFRTLTDRSKSVDEYTILFKDFISKMSLNETFEGAIISSVVPSLTAFVSQAITNAFGCKCLVVGPGLKSGVQIKIDNPSELGADLLCDSVGALNKYGKATLIVDLGTASKILLVDSNGAFAGGPVMPGIMISAKALSNNAALLTESSLIAPKNVLGKNTADCMNSGSIYGTVAMVEGLCNMIEKEIGYKCNRVLTGGYAPLVKDYLDSSFVYDANLILDGLYMIYKRNEK